VDRGRAERARITGVSCQARIGVRIHWLCRDEQTPRILEEGGFAWDASLGYNETVGYLNGTIQPFRPAGATTLLELPLHIQDGALFYPTRLNLTEPDAWARCALLVADAHRHGGALTVLWHDRSHAPERFWGDFYVRLLESLRTSGAWFATAGEVIDWFARRRAVRFERTGAGIRFSSEGGDITPPLRIRVHHPAAAGNPPRWVDVPWTGGEVPELPRVPAPTLPDAAVRRTASACV
jgi:hypothetical protein